jgi:glycosyltransferase involved in cell wall biosynthesis
MTGTVSISVIICTWNRAASLRATLTSLAAQTGIAPNDIEVIVVDNNSHDETRAVVEEMQAAWRLGSLRYLFEPRQGKQFALNRGIGESRHPLLAFTDDDVLLPADWLFKAADLFTDPTVELAGGKTLVLWPQSTPPAWFAREMSAIVAAVDLGDARLDPAPPGYAPAGTNLFAQRRLIERVGAFSETHFRHMDYEFGLRCRRGGARIVYDPAIVVLTPVIADCLSKRYFRRWSFKAGITPDAGHGLAQTPWRSVPRWVYRELIQDGLYLAGRSWFDPAAHAFTRELHFWRRLGTVASAWHAWLWPADHPRWVSKYSQKKQNVY